MPNDEAKPTKLPKHLLSFIVFLLVLLALFLLVIWWYNRKITNIQSEEQQLRKDLSALVPKNKDLSN
jgi:hypothetical protein